MDWSRRDILATSGALAIAMATGGCEQIFENIKNRPLRRNVSNLDPAGIELTTFRDGVAAMKALPAADCRSWTAQANIHLNFCPHGNWYFLPWHRAYLYCLERIIQTLTGNTSFGLPYWNWQTNRSIPAAFWVAGSPLFHAPRTATSASQALVSMVGAANIESILDETDFEVFASYAATALRGGGGAYGRLEGEPHNYMHGFVGGTMGGFTSPLDPVFWSHHAILDYHWAHWNIERENANPSDPAWADFDLAGMFCDGDGNPVTYKVGITPIMPLISYRYEADTVGNSASAMLRKAAGGADEKAMRKFLETGAPVRFRARAQQRVADTVLVRAGQPASARVQLPPALLTNTLAASPSERTFLRLASAATPADESYFVRVFIDKPDANAATPIDDPSFAGSFAFFSDPKVMNMSPDHQVEISGALRRRQARGGAAAVVTLVPVPIEAGRRVSAEPFQVGGMTVVTSDFDPVRRAR